LASGDSGGIRAGATDGGGELAGFVTQPLASSIGASSASISSRSFFLCMGSRLLLRLGASLFFCSSIPLTEHFGQAIAAVARCGSRDCICAFYRSAILVYAPVRSEQRQQQSSPDDP
jgi:hypothetical protein